MPLPRTFPEITLILALIPNYNPSLPLITLGLYKVVVVGRASYWVGGLPPQGHIRYLLALLFPREKRRRPLSHTPRSMHRPVI